MRLPWLNRFRSVRAHVSVFGIALGLSQLPACKAPLDAQPPPPILVADPAPSPLPMPSVSASATSTGPVITDTPLVAAFVADGTLIAFGKRVLLAMGRDGTAKRQALPSEALVEFSDQLPGVVIQTKEGLSLLGTPSLVELYRGKGKQVLETSSAVVLPDDGVVLTAGVGGLVRLALPKEEANGLKAGTAQVFAVHSVANHSRLNVTVSKDADALTGFSSLLFDASGASLGRGVPLSCFGGYPPQGAWVGTAGFVLEGGRVIRIDLTSGKVQRQSVVTCRKGAFLGNPSPSPNGETLLLTCGEDGVILNATTLAERRRVPRILPGCDNGPFLGGNVLSDNHTFRVEGCGGEARLDLSTGRYACSDDPHLVGVPYEFGYGLANTPALPAGRTTLPRCGGSADTPGQRLALGQSGRFSVLLGDQLSVVHAGGTIVLETSGLPAISQDEALIAYVADQSVIVRSLPGGEVKRTLTLDLP